MIHASRLRRRGKALDYLLPQRQQFSRKKGNTRTSRATLKTVLALSAPFALYGLHAFASGDDTTVTQGRKLAGSVAEGACDEWQNGENHTGTVILNMIIILYSFVALAVVCDDWFVDALEEISEALKLSDDVAGATFMAAGSSAPELFTSIADSFGPANNIGIGTIVGSAMFNILIIVALAAAVAPGSLKIDFKPILRDVSFYSLSIAEMVIFFGDGSVYWWEAMIMVLSYVGYIIFMVFNPRIFAWCDKTCGDKSAVAPSGEAEQKYEKDDEDEGKNTESGDTEKQAAKDGDKDKEEEHDVGFFDNEDGFDFKFPKGGKERVQYILLAPIYAFFTVFIPKFHYWGTFTLSILWIGGLCWIMVALATQIGCIMKIPAQAMGILVLAVGTSVPDAMGSMIEAKEGKADMAIANAVGSNVFDILLGLGLPWMAAGLINDSVVVVDTDGIIYEVIILYGTVVIFAGSIILNKFYMNATLGKTFVFCYILYIVYVIFQKAM